MVPGSHFLFGQHPVAQPLGVIATALGLVLRLADGNLCEGTRLDLDILFRHGTGLVQKGLVGLLGEGEGEG